MRVLFAATAILGLSVAAVAPAQAVELFDFEFRAGGQHHIGTDNYRHYNDFRHNNDYYKFEGFLDPERHANCRTERDRSGDTQRVECRGKRSTGSTPGY